MKKVLILIGFLIFQNSFGQVTANKNEQRFENEIVAVPNFEDVNEANLLYNSSGIEVKPDFPGGISKFYEYIGKNFNAPYTKVGGKIFVSFVIEKDGSLTEIKVLRDIGFGTREEALRVFKKCPNWKPGLQNGKPVRCQYTLPISIQPSK
jgi:protein TonB